MKLSPKSVLGSFRLFLVACICALTVARVLAQSAPITDDMPRRLARARALAAAHNLPAARAELNAIRISTKDEAIRGVVRVMLMGIHLEEADYTSAKSLLEETFAARSVASTSQTYFALAGQAVRGARAHLDRYRSFGISLDDTSLPPDSISDLDRLRSLLDRLAEQVKEIGSENLRNSDAGALLEDVATIRLQLARSDQEKILWEIEVKNGREMSANAQSRAVASEPVVASVAPPAARSFAPPGSSAPTPKPIDTRAQTANGEVNQISELVEVGSLTEKATQKVTPVYPQTARTARISGIVTVHLVLDEKGNVVAVVKTSGPEMLKQAGADAAKLWKFKPTTLNGQPIRVAGFVTFNFSL